MKILFATSSSVIDSYPRIAAAYVNIDKPLAAIIAKRRLALLEIKAEDEDILELYFKNQHCIWLNRDKVDDLVPDDEYVTSEQADFDFHVGDDADTECDQMVVCERGVHWTCIPKHTDVYISTPVIEFSKIRELI